MKTGHPLLDALREASGPWAQTPQNRLEIIRSYVSPDFIDILGLSRNNAPGQSLTLTEIYDIFSSSERDHLTPLAYRNEAAEVCYALGFYITKRPEKRYGTITGRNWLGRVCKLCWRTEAFRRGRGLLGRCHRHHLPARPDVFENEASRRLHLEIRNSIDRAKLLLRTAPEAQIEGNGYPCLPPRPPHADLTAATWREYVKTNFKLSFSELLRGKGEDALMNHLATASALEDRALTGMELAELLKPSDVIPSLRRCEAWQQLIQKDRER